MKTLIWKLRFAYHFRKMAFCSWRIAWQSAAANVESYGDEIDIWPPKEAAEDEIEAGRACQ